MGRRRKYHADIPPAYLALDISPPATSRPAMPAAGDVACSRCRTRPVRSFVVVCEDCYVASLLAIGCVRRNRT